MAEKLYEHFLARCREQADVVEKGQFGADMKVELLNDGPFTLMLDLSLIHIYTLPCSSTRYRRADPLDYQCGSAE